MRLPPDDNKVIPEVAAPCLTKFTKPGGRKRQPPDIVVPPGNPGGTGPPPGTGFTGFTGPGGGGQPGWCSCFMHKHTLTTHPVNYPGYKNCTQYNYSWKQTCEPSNQSKEFRSQPGNKDPFGGYSDYQAVLALFWNPPPGKVLKVWGQGGGKPHAWCRDPVKGTCSKKCNTLTLWWVWCEEGDITVPPGVVPPPGGPTALPPGPITPGGGPGVVPPGPITPPGGGPTALPPGPITPRGGPTPLPPIGGPGGYIPPPEPWESGEKGGGGIPIEAWEDLNVPEGWVRQSIPENPFDYSVDRDSRGNTPFIENSFTSFIPSPYNPGTTFFNWKNPQIISKATLTENKDVGDINNILKEGEINKVLETYLIPTSGVNNNTYNDKTLSIFMNRRSSFIEESLSKETLQALHLVGESNVVSLSLSQELREVIYSAVMDGKLDSYSPQLFTEMYELGKNVFGNSFPGKLSDKSFNFMNAMTYISRNLHSLYPKSYPDNGDESRFVAHTLALPPEYQLSLGVTPRVGDPVAVRVGLNFTFPVYDRDGVKRNINEFLDFFNVLDRSATERIVSLNSNRSNLYTLDATKESRVMELLEASDSVKENKITTTYEVSSPSWVTASGYEMNSSPNDLSGAYLLKLNLSSITQEGSPSPFLRRYKGTYNAVWGEKDGLEDDVFNDAIKTFGPHRVVYLPNDPWWSYFNVTNAVDITFTALNVEGYLPGLPEVIVGTQIPQTILLVPTEDRVRTNPLNGRSVLRGFEAGQTVKRIFTTTLSPLVESEVYLKPVKDTTEIDLQGDHDIYALKFEKNFSVGEFSSVATPAPITTGITPIADYVNRVNNLKDNYNLEFDGSNTLTHFDLYKGFSLNQLLTILSVELGDVINLTGVKLIDTKLLDLDTPTSFITESYLRSGGSANTTNYIGSDEFPKIMYFPPDYDHYN